MTNSYVMHALCNFAGSLGTRGSFLKTHGRVLNPPNPRWVGYPWAGWKNENLPQTRVWQGGQYP